MNKFRALMLVLLTRPVAVLLTALLAVALLAISCTSLSADGVVWSRGNMAMVYDEMQQSTRNVKAVDAPSTIVEAFQQETELLGAALAADSESAYLKLLGDYGAWGLKNGAAGDLALTANMQFLVSLGALDQPQLFYSLNESPGVVPLLAILGSLLPYFLLLMVPLVVSWNVASLFSRGAVLASAPLASWRSFLMSWACAVLCALTALVAVVLPVIVVSTLRSGWVGLEYPSVYVQSGQLIVQTLGGVLGQWILLMVLSSMFLAGVVCALAWIARSPNVGAAVAALCCLLPAFPFWMADNAGSVFLALPSTYLDAPRVAGVLSVGAGADVSAVQGATWGLGVAVLAGWTLGLVALSALVVAVRERRLPRRVEDGACGGLRAIDLTLRYGDRAVLQGVHQSFARGHLYGLVAPNGHGKTTLLRALAGQASCRVQGTIAADEVGLGDPALYRAAVHYSTGDAAYGLLRHVSVARHLKLVAAFWKSGRSVDDAVRLFGLAPFVRKPPEGLSQGMAQLASLAVAYMTGARYLLLDEPMNALDPTNVRTVSNVLRALVADGACVVMSSHILTNVEELCDSVLYIADKTLVPYEGGGVAQMYERMYSV